MGYTEGTGLSLRSLGRTDYFEAKKQWSVLDALMNPMVTPLLPRVRLHSSLFRRHVWLTHVVGFAISVGTLYVFELISAL